MSGVVGWGFHNPVRIVFGSGRLDHLGTLGGVERFLLVTTPGFTRRGVTERVEALVGAHRLVVYDDVEPNPDLRAVEGAAAEFADAGVDAVIALGGGSALDTGKALATMLGEGGGTFSLRSHLMEGAPLPEGRPLPLFAVPTTAGTGAEVTPFATIWDREGEKKYSLAGPSVFPHTAILDPLLTVGLPESETVASGLDALSQGLESIWNRNANPITISLASRAVRVALESLIPLVDSPGDLELRAAMQEASLLSGLAISVTRTALAHSMSYPLTARYGVPHGLACSFTLPALLEYNMAADDGRLDALATGLGMGWVELRRVLLELLLKLEVPERIRGHISTVDELLELVPEMYTPGRADNNLREVGGPEISHILAMAWRDLGLS